MENNMQQAKCKEGFTVDMFTSIPCNDLVTFEPVYTDKVRLYWGDKEMIVNSSVFDQYFMYYKQSSLF